MNEVSEMQRGTITDGWASRTALTALLGAVASLAFATTGWSYGGMPSNVATVRPAGPRPSGTGFFNVEGSDNNANASFGVLEFTASSFNIGAPVTSVSNLLLSLTESNASFSAPGAFNIYLSQDTTTSILPATAPNPPALTFQTAAGTEGIGSQLSPLNLLGTGTFSTVGNTNSGKVDTFSLSLPGSVNSYFLNQINSGGILRFVFTPTTTSTGATFAGSTAAAATRPLLSFDASLNQPSLGWKGGAGNWNPAGTAGDTSWSGGPWQSNQTAIFNAAGGVVSLTGAVTAVGMTFDSDGYTISGNASTPLTLTGGLVQVTNSAQTATVSAVVAGTVGVTKNGSGTLVLSGQNTYTGATTVNGGTLIVNSDRNLGADANGVALNNGTLRPSAALALGAGRTLSGSGTLDLTGGTLTVNGTVAAGTLTITHGAATFVNPTSIATADVQAGASLEFTSGLVGSARTFLQNDGAIILGDSSGFSSGVTIARGVGTVGPTVTLTSGGSLGGGTTNFNGGVLQSASDITVGNQVSLGGNATIGGTTAGTTGAFEFAGSGFNLFGTTKKTLTINVPTTISTGITPTVGATQNNSFNKAGLGRLIITAPGNTYEGGTTITGGTIEVGSTSTLGKGSVVVTALAVAHVTLQIDNDRSIDDMSDVILNSTGSFHGQLNLSFAATDAPEIINSLSIDGKPVGIGTYRAADLGVLYPNIILGSGRLTINNLSTAPEPSTCLAMGVSFALLAGWKMRRKVRS